MNPEHESSECSSVCLDERQIVVQELLIDHCSALDVAAEVRFERFSSLFTIQNPQRNNLATSCRDQVRDLEQKVATIAGNIPEMSTPEGTVHPENSELYLDQEIIRAQSASELADWRRRHQLHRKYIQDTLNGSRPPEGQTELFVWDQATKALDHLSNLTPEEDIERAVCVLAEIQRKQIRMSTALWSAPLNSVKAAATTVASTVALFGVGAGLLTGVGTTGLQYGYQGYDNYRQRRKLSAPEAGAIATINKHGFKYRTFVQTCMINLNVEGSIEELLDG
ncbi:MAG: hypothetical protein HOG89_04995 [Candidatus Peribacter sp.]|jgi:hypothetical protein|nr:hypothetical protein [Candidatus Peribacter sp.]MBT4392613.1 hypothetical protein [Candidatus Peribacter sp.]MBT4600417.1 hypothetical protein [Candidatus Peribacter sp.]MBT5149091.1 hypothetical protein [Candidatus Peribacter sp.]MBT5637567.1 hypothetical protein [Candidatus Peribacter sp.]